MRFYFFCCFSWFAFTLSAQNLSVIDSLRREFPKADPAKKFALLNAIGFEYRYSYPDSTIAYCTRAYELGKKLSLSKDLSKPLSFIGLANSSKGDYKNSLKYHNEAIEVALRQNDSIQLAFGYNNLGRMFFDEGDFARAYDNLTRSRDLFETLQNKAGLAYVYRSLANVYKSQNDFGQALEMSNRAYELRREIGEPRAIVSALLELGLVLEAMNDNDHALRYFRLGDSIATKINDKVTKAELKIGLAEILLKHGKYEEAVRAADDVLKAVTEQTNQKIYLRAIFIHARYFYELHDYTRAIQLLDKILVVSENNLVFQRDASFLLAEIYLAKHNAVRADEYSNKYKILNERLHSTDLSLQVERLKFQLELETMEKENDSLKADQSKNYSQIYQQKIQNILLLIAVAFISIVVLILWVNSRRRRLINHQLALQNQQILFQREEIEQKNENLSVRNKDLSDLNHEKDTLMNIVAHDLKSPINRILGLTQILEMEGTMTAAQKEYLELIKSSTHAGLDLIIDLLDVNALREVKGELNYSAFNLGALINERVKSFELTAQTKKIKLEVRNNIQDTVVSEPKYLNRILDNLISNAIKFSTNGSVVNIAARLEENAAQISVKDQGPGFSAQDREMMFQRFKKLSAKPTGGENSNGLGLAIVKILIDRLGGTIELISQPGTGSEFILRIPMNVVAKAAL
jgi:signal transduction histidine kinase